MYYTKINQKSEELAILISEQRKLPENDIM